MDQIDPRHTLSATHQDAATEYLVDMIEQLARMARQAGEMQVAIHLEAIIAARRAISKDRSS